MPKTESQNCFLSAYGTMGFGNSTSYISLSCRSSIERMETWGHSYFSNKKWHATIKKDVERFKNKKKCKLIEKRPL